MPLIVFNLLSLGLSGTILFLKLRHRRGAQAQHGTGPIRPG
jgi:hypothetical protein